MRGFFIVPSKHGFYLSLKNIVTIDVLLSGTVAASARCGARGAPNGDLDELAPASGGGYVAAAPGPASENGTVK